MDDIIDESKIKELEGLLLKVIKNLIETMYGFKESAFNKVPFEGSWTGAQVCSHVIKSLDFIHQIVSGESKTTHRDPEQHVLALKAIMEDMSVKGQSATILLPDINPITRMDIRESLTDSEQKVLQSIRSLELSSTCTAMEFPGMGYLTRYEFISFTAFHTKRHTIQLNNIHRVLIASND